MDPVSGCSLRNHGLRAQDSLGDIVRESTDGKAIVSAYRDYGYTLSEIAEHLGVHYSTVSRRLGQHETES
ncbi:sigma-70 family RNA polymerase sigma factor [Candidatus Bipolaricaulota bacterium]|nr:sigma-70 family RNA polymerase sigma factor [Candidatus Bipolaricaulota bacterium]